MFVVVFVIVFVVVLVIVWSGGEHCQPELAVEVRCGTLPSGTCG